jgi:hypothetical protein
VPTFTLQVQDDDELRQVHLDSLIRGGLLVRAAEVLPIDSKVRVHFRPPRSKAAIELVGRVCHIEIDQSTGESVPVGMGVQFVNLSHQAEEELAKLIIKYEYLDEPEAQPPDDPDVLARDMAEFQQRTERAELQMSRLQPQLDRCVEEDRSGRALVERLQRDRDARLQGLGDAGDIVERSEKLLEQRSALEKTRDGLRQARERVRVLQDSLAEQTESDVAASHEESPPSALDRLVTELEGELEKIRERRRTMDREFHDAAEPTRQRALELEHEIAQMRDEMESVIAAQRQQVENLSKDLARARWLLGEVRTGVDKLRIAADESKRNYEHLRARKRDQDRLLALSLPASRETAPDLDFGRDELAAIDRRLESVTHHQDGPQVSKGARHTASVSEPSRGTNLLEPTDTSPSPAEPVITGDLTPKQEAKAGDPGGNAEATPSVPWLEPPDLPLDVSEQPTLPPWSSETAGRESTAEPLPAGQDPSPPFPLEPEAPSPRQQSTPEARQAETRDRIEPTWATTPPKEQRAGDSLMIAPGSSPPSAEAPRRRSMLMGVVVGVVIGLIGLVVLLFILTQLQLGASGKSPVPPATPSAEDNQIPQTPS